MHNLALLIAQIATILIAARLLGFLFQKLNQPRVIGEMVAGILLGPSLLGWLSPRVSTLLFPPDSLSTLNSLSQVGLLLFMFLVGLELDLRRLRELGRAAIVTSQVSIIVPFALGFFFALHLYPRFANESVNFVGFALFIGSAMSITAFPVLARILTERNLLRTRIGSVAITCAAVDDVTAWCILACIIVVVRASNLVLPLWLTIAGLITFVGLMIFPVRMALAALAQKHRGDGPLTHDAIAIIFLIVLASGWTTEYLGVHALFGGFLVGVVMPRRPEFIKEIWFRLETVVVVLLLPLYFAFTGLRSSFFLISGLEMWGYTLVIIAIAV